MLQGAEYFLGLKMMVKSRVVKLLYLKAMKPGLQIVLQERLSKAPPIQLAAYRKRNLESHKQGRKRNLSFSLSNAQLLSICSCLLVQVMERDLVQCQACSQDGKSSSSHLTYVVRLDKAETRGTHSASAAVRTQAMPVCINIKL